MDTCLSAWIHADLCLFRSFLTFCLCPLFCRYLSFNCSKEVEQLGSASSRVQFGLTSVKGGLLVACYAAGTRKDVMTGFTDFYREKVNIKKFQPGGSDGHLVPFFAPTMMQWTPERLGKLATQFNDLHNACSITPAQLGEAFLTKRTLKKMVCPHTHTHTHTHTHIHTSAHTEPTTHTHTDTHTHTHTCTHTRPHRHKYTHICTRTHNTHTLN